MGNTTRLRRRRRRRRRHGRTNGGLTCRDRTLLCMEVVCTPIIFQIYDGEVVVIVRIGPDLCTHCSSISSGISTTGGFCSVGLGDASL